MEQDIKLSADDELLLLCARTHMDVETGKRIKYLVSGNINWVHLLKIASKNKLKPLLYWQLNQISPDSIPCDVIDDLRIYFKTNVQNNFLMLSELLRILKLFESEGIMAVPYKGPVLALNTYGNLALREFIDLDIFVKNRDISKVMEILLREKYSPDIYMDDSKKIKYLDVRRDFNYINKQGIKIEIHKYFQSWDFSLPETHNFLDEKINIMLTNNQQVINPSIENMILILSIHNANHRWARLSWLCDTAEIIKANKRVDWNFIIEKAEKLIIKRILLINLYILKNLFDVNLPNNIIKLFEHDTLIKKYANNAIKLLFTDENKKISLTDEIMKSIKLRDNLFYGIRDCIKPIFTPTLYEWETLPLPVYLWPIYHIYRPLNLLFRYNLK
jgi:hypothetical protein